MEKILAIKARDWTPKVLGVLTLIGYFSIQWYLLVSIVDQSMREIVMRSLGTLDALVGYVFGFYYGGSNNTESGNRQPQEVKKDQDGNGR